MSHNNPDKKKQDLEIRLQQGDPTALRLPRFHIDCEHPFRVRNRQGGLRVVSPKCEWYLYIPMGEVWSASARGFGQTKGAAVANSSKANRDLLYAMFFIGCRLGSKLENGVPKIFITWTPVPSAADEKVYAGYLLRFTFQIPPGEPAGMLHDYLNAVEKNFLKSMEKGKLRYFDPEWPSYKRFRPIDYAHAAQFYWAAKLCEPEQECEVLENLDNESNPFNPFKVFTLSVAVRKMRNSGAHADFCQESSYRGAAPGHNDDKPFLLPRDGDLTWLMPPCELNPLRMDPVFFPHVPTNLDLQGEELNNYLKQSGVQRPGDNQSESKSQDMDVADTDSEATVGEEPSAALSRYLRHVSTSDVETEQTLLTFKYNVTKRMEDANRGGKENPALKWRLRREAQLESITEFFTSVFVPDDTADCGNALKAHAREYQRMLQERRNFMMPNPKSSRNLSRFADMQASEAATYESVFALNTAHQEVKSIRLAGMHVYFYSPFHCHTALLGPPGSGKSNAFQQNIDMLIEGTSRDICTESAKAKMTHGKTTDLMIEYYEDIPPGQIGVAAYNPRGETSTANTDAESLLKYRLTKGKAKGVYKHVENGAHSMKEVESFCNTVMLIGSNTILNAIPSSIASRFNCIQFQYKDRKDTQGNDQGLFSKYALAQDKTLDPLRKQLITRAKRNQLFHCMIELLCWAGVFQMPDMTVANLIWSSTLAKGKAKGLMDTNNIRHFERLTFHCQTTVVEHAIDMVLDSEVSPLDLDKPWHPHDLIHFEKHLYANTEHASFTLGMLEHQFEPPIITNVEKYLKTVLLKKVIATGKPGKDDLREKHPDIHKQLSHYWVLDRTLGNALAEKDKQDTTSNLSDLARHIQRSMLPRPAEGEVLYALQCLSKLEITVESRPGETMPIPALTFSKDGELMVAVQLMENFERNCLQTCLRKVLQHEFTKPKNIIYGRTHPSRPYLWSTMTIQSCKGNRLVMENPSYCPPALKKLISRYVEGVTRTCFEPDQQHLNLDDIKHGALDEMFSSTSHSDVDVDLDQWISWHRADRIGLKYFPLTPDAPRGDTSMRAINRVIHQQLQESGVDELELYPQCFAHLLQSIMARHETAKEKASNPERFSLKAKMQRKRAQEEMDGGAVMSELFDLDEEDDDGDLEMCSDGAISDNEEPPEDEDDKPVPQPPEKRLRPFGEAKQLRLETEDFDADDFDRACVGKLSISDNGGPAAAAAGGGRGWKSRYQIEQEQKQAAEWDAFDNYR